MFSEVKSSMELFVLKTSKLINQQAEAAVEICFSSDVRGGDPGERGP